MFLIKLYKVVLTFHSVDETLKCDHSDESHWAVLSRRTVYDKNFLTFCVCRFSSVSKGTTWSVVLYSITAAAACREQHWREASQAFYRVSMVYSNMQATACAGTLYQLTTFPNLSLHFPRASPPFLTLSRSLLHFSHSVTTLLPSLPQFSRSFIALLSHFHHISSHFYTIFSVLSSCIPHTFLFSRISFLPRAPVQSLVTLFSGTSFWSSFFLNQNKSCQGK